MGVHGGFQGRTNKLVDGCYSFWQVGSYLCIELGGGRSSGAAGPTMQLAPRHATPRGRAGGSRERTGAHARRHAPRSLAAPGSLARSRQGGAFPLLEAVLGKHAELPAGGVASLFSTAGLLDYLFICCQVPRASPSHRPSLRPHRPSLRPTTRQNDARMDGAAGWTSAAAQCACVDDPSARARPPPICAGTYARSGRSSTLSPSGLTSASRPLLATTPRVLGAIRRAARQAWPRSRLLPHVLLPLGPRRRERRATRPLVRRGSPRALEVCPRLREPRLQHRRAQGGGRHQLVPRQLTPCDGCASSADRARVGPWLRSTRCLGSSRSHGAHPFGSSSALGWAWILGIDSVTHSGDGFVACPCACDANRVVPRSPM